MSRLPVVGSDDGTWGSVLNDFLSVSLNADGTLKALTESQVTNLVSDLASKYVKPPTGIPESDLDNATQTTLNSVAGKANTSSLATVATSGSYTDLLNRPTTEQMTEPPIPALEVLPMTGYGHSYVAGPPTGSGDGARFFDRVANRLKLRSYTNNGQSGKNIVTIARKVFDTWTGGTSYGVVGLCCTANNLQTTTTNIEGNVTSPFRLIMATLHSSGRFEDTSTACVFTGTWTANTGNTYFSGGTYHSTTTIGDYVDIYCDTDPCYVSVGLGTSGNGVITATRAGDGATVATFDTGITSSSGQMGALRLSGLAGATTVRLTLTSGTQMQFDCVLPQSSSPPLVIWQQEPDVPANGSTKNTIQDQNTFPAIQTMLNNEFPATITVPPGAGFNSATMNLADGMHFTDIGNYYLATQAVTAIINKNLTYTTGQNITSTPLSSSVASAPAYYTGTSAVTLIRQNTAITPYSTNSLALSLTSSYAGHGLVLSVSTWQSGPVAVSSITDSANNTWTKVTSQSSSSFGGQELWYVASGVGSTGTLAVTVNFASNTSAATNITEWSKHLAVDQFTSSSTTGTAPSIQVTSASTDLVIATLNPANNATPAATSPAVTLQSSVSSVIVDNSAYVVASNGTKTTVAFAAISSTTYGMLISSFTVS